MRDILSWLGGRKLIVFLLTFVYLVVATFAKVPIPAEAVELLKWVGGAYMVGNVGVAVANNIGKKQ